MNSFFWLSRFWRMPSDTDTVERFNSSTPSAMPLTYNTTSGRLVLAFAPLTRSPPGTVTSSATAKSLASGSAHFTSHTVTVFSPASGRTFTP